MSLFSLSSRLRRGREALEWTVFALRHEHSSPPSWCQPPALLAPPAWLARDGSSLLPPSQRHEPTLRWWILGFRHVLASSPKPATSRVPPGHSAALTIAIRRVGEGLGPRPLPGVPVGGTEEVAVPALHGAFPGPALVVPGVHPAAGAEPCPHGDYGDAWRRCPPAPHLLQSGAAQPSQSTLGVQVTPGKPPPGHLHGERGEGTRQRIKSRGLMFHPCVPFPWVPLGAPTHDPALWGPSTFPLFSTFPGLPLARSLVLVTLLWGLSGPREPARLGRMPLAPGSRLHRSVCPVGLEDNRNPFPCPMSLGVPWNHECRGRGWPQPSRSCGGLRVHRGRG